MLKGNQIQRFLHVKANMLAWLLFLVFPDPEIQVMAT